MSTMPPLPGTPFDLERIRRLRLHGVHFGPTSILRIGETGFNSIEHPQRSIQRGYGLSLSFRWDDSAAVLDLNSPLVQINEHIVVLLCDEAALCSRSNKSRKPGILAGIKHSPQDEFD